VSAAKRFGLAAALVALAGCGGASHGLQAVSGTVTLGGKPLDHGSVTFLTTIGEPGPAGGAAVTAGRFHIPAEHGLEPGAYRVSVSAPVPGGTLTPAEVAAGASPKARERVPAKYNAEAAITVEVRAGATNRFDLQLEE
jgi:hypothetical protein